MKKKLGIAGICLLLVSLVVVTMPQSVRSAQFVLASWDYPQDDYGQGIWKITVLENSTGSWVMNSSRFYNESQSYEWDAGLVIGLYIYTWLNSTLTGAIDHDDGINLQRLGIEVTNNNGTSVFSQQNMTCVFSQEGDPSSMWLYTNSIILNFLPLDSQIYAVTITYEIFYSDE